MRHCPSERCQRDFLVYLFPEGGHRRLVLQPAGMLLQGPAAIGDEPQGRLILGCRFSVWVPIWISDLFANAADAEPVAAETHHLIIEACAKVRNFGRHI